MLPPPHALAIEYSQGWVRSHSLQGERNARHDQGEVDQPLELQVATPAKPSQALVGFECAGLAIAKAPRRLAPGRRNAADRPVPLQAVRDRTEVTVQQATRGAALGGTRGRQE